MIKQCVSRVLLLSAIGILAPAAWGIEANPFVNEEAVPIDQRRLLTSVISRNGQALFARLQQQIAEGNFDEKSSLMQPEFFAEGRYTDQDTKNSATDVATNPGKRESDAFEQQELNLETGVRLPTATGAELIMSWSGTQRDNNLKLVGIVDTPEEFTGSLNLSVRQPLLQGFGNRITESRIEEASLEQRVVEEELHRELLTVSAEALRVYWQIYMAERFIEVETSALKNADNIMNETQSQVDAGRQPNTSMWEAEARVLQSQSSLHAEEQRWRDSQSQLKTLLSLPGDEFDALTFGIVDRPVTAAYPMPEDFTAYADNLLQQWPGYRAAKWRQQIQEQVLTRAEEENRNKLDLVTGYRTSSFDTQGGDALNDSFQTDHPTWYVGLEFSMPIGTNLKRKGAVGSAQAQQRQADLALRDVRVELINELRNRLAQLDVAHGDLKRARRNQELYEDLFEVELKRYNVGQSRLRELYEREDDRILAQKRYAKALADYQLAIIGMQLAEGTLFERYNINIASVDDL
jgi:outer membrane protein TolC